MENIQRLHVCSELPCKESINSQKDCHDLKAVFCVSQFPNFNSSWIQISDITCIAASVLLNLQFLCFISNAVLQRAVDNSQNLWCCLYCLGNSAPLLLSFKILTPRVAYLEFRAWLTNIKVPLLPHQSQAFYYTKGKITAMGTIFRAYKFCSPSKPLNSLNLFTGA